MFEQRSSQDMPKKQTQCIHATVYDHYQYQTLTYNELCFIVE